jgi:serine/threonine protein kinase
MLKGEAYEGLGVDIWAAGVILFAMACGYLPF